MPKARSERRSKKPSEAKLEQIREAQASMVRQKLSKFDPIVPARRRTKKDVEATLQITQGLLRDTETQLKTSTLQVSLIQNELKTTREALIQTRIFLRDALAKNAVLYRLLRVERRKTQRSTLAKATLSLSLKEKNAALAVSQKSHGFLLTTCNISLAAQDDTITTLR
ncbi:hypothetical protein C8R43DRAFT_1135166 [Mycena crocata]|nr:hypothetical protein C8R43DRAFT_1135166 [Mycena crocata]